MKIHSLSGTEVDIKEEQIDALKISLCGPMVSSGEAGYEDLRSVWNATIDRKPAMIVRCMGTADIIACVKFAREHKLLLCIKGGGHNIAGFWEEEKDDDKNIGWARAAWDDMKSFSTGGPYINFLTEDDGPERNEAALGENIKRLAEIKATWDPDNFFRINRNITAAQQA